MCGIVGFVGMAQACALLELLLGGGQPGGGGFLVIRGDEVFDLEGSYVQHATASFPYSLNFCGKTPKALLKLV